MSADKKQKQITQLTELFGLGSDVIERQIQETLDFAEEFKDDLNEQDTLAMDLQLSAMRQELQNEKDNPLAERVYEAMVKEIGEKKLTTILNVMTSKEYKTFFDVLDDTIVSQTGKIIDFIDAGLALEQGKNDGVKLH
jgi:hypothetical protein